MWLVQDGVHRDSAALEELSADELKLLKSQDLAYVNTKKQVEKKVRVWTCVQPSRSAFVRCAS